tara:strand:+ start:989 stop:1273 length:285 start_codon:yes stop_codon:yes gene_type:complete
VAEFFKDLLANSALISLYFDISVFHSTAHTATLLEAFCSVFQDVSAHGQAFNDGHGFAPSAFGFAPYAGNTVALQLGCGFATDTVSELALALGA